jgi:hypothetical protein
VSVGNNYEYYGSGNESRAFVKQESIPKTVKSHAKMCVLGHKGTKDSPLEIILPNELGWYCLPVKTMATFGAP